MSMKHIIELYLENISKIRVEVTCPKLNGRMWCYEWKKSEALRVGRLNLDSVVNGG